MTDIPGVQGNGANRSRDRLPSREIFACLARAGRYRDDETADHVERMSRSCGLIASRLGFGHAECAELVTASAMHDIGKIGVPDAVLLKPGALTPSERELIERHAEIGSQILAGSSDPVMELAASIALTHHERVDGGGYPNHLRGEQIPLPGRIAAVADVFDALTHDRVYRSAFSADDALAIVRGGRGSQFDERVIDAFDEVLPAILQVQRVFAAGSREASPYRMPDRDAGPFRGRLRLASPAD